MLHIVRAEGMKRRDLRMMDDIGVPSAVLMERAALETARAVMEMLSEAGGHCGKESRVLVLCGSGNNGGDGFACARILTLKGISCAVYPAGNPDHMTEECGRQYRIVRKMGIPVTDRVNPAEYGLIVDALFGIGISRDISGRYEDLIGQVNDSGVPVVAVDIPSGIDADTGQVRGCAIRAQRTVTMQLLKPGLLLYPGASYAGSVTCAEIGVEDIPDERPLLALERKDLRAWIPPRNPAGNKSDFGRVLIVGGSRNMAGAACLAALSALRSGCGMVRVLTDECNREIVQSVLPEALLSTWTSAEDAQSRLAEAAAWADVIAAGPGLGKSEAAQTMVRWLLTEAEHPLVLDADALNLTAASMLPLLEAHRGPVIVTPHMGEMARLTGSGVSELKLHPFDAASAFADRYGAVCVMKDARTVTAVPGGPLYLNLSGNDGMAGAGSGDVLTGVTAALLARGTDPAGAGALGAFLHGLAGDSAAEKHGRSGMMASDIAEAMRDLRI